MYIYIASIPAQNNYLDIARSSYLSQALLHSTKHPLK